MLRSLFVALVVLSGVLTAACSGEPVDQGPPPVGSLVVGLTSELRLGVDIDRVRLVMRSGGEVIRDEVLAAGDPALALPAEFRFPDLAGGTPLQVQVEGLAADRVLVERSAVTEIVAGRTLLLRLALEVACVPPPGTEAICEPAATCLGGACRDPRVDPALLEDYSSEWRSGIGDVCKPAGAGAPVVTVGEGQADYLPQSDLDEAQIEKGPQGGNHIWVAVRMKNLRQSGTTSEITGYVPELDLVIPAFRVIFTFDPDEGGYCELHGLRFQLDQTVDIGQLFGEVLEVTVRVEDADGSVGVGERTVVLSAGAIG